MKTSETALCDESEVERLLRASERARSSRECYVTVSRETKVIVQIAFSAEPEVLDLDLLILMPDHTNYSAITQIPKLPSTFRIHALFDHGLLAQRLSEKSGSTQPI